AQEPEAPMRAGAIPEASAIPVATMAKITTEETMATIDMGEKPGTKKKELSRRNFLANHRRLYAGVLSRRTAATGGRGRSFNRHQLLHHRRHRRNHYHLILRLRNGPGRDDRIATNRCRRVDGG